MLVGLISRDPHRRSLGSAGREPGEGYRQSGADTHIEHRIEYRIESSLRLLGDIGDRERVGAGESERG